MLEIGRQKKKRKKRKHCREKKMMIFELANRVSRTKKFAMALGEETRYQSGRGFGEAAPVLLLV